MIFLTIKQDLEKYDNFRRKFDPVYASKQSGATGIKFNWPNQPQRSNIFQSNNNAKMEDEDIYN